MNLPRALDDHPVMAQRILRGFHMLEADAGTGKTWTLSGLVVRMLVERRLEIDRVLVVTFTRAATAQLSERIRSRIEETARALGHRLGIAGQAVSDPFCVAYAARVADPDRALRDLRVALSRIDEAQVRTIHSFCHRVITEHAMSIGLARGLRAQALGTEWIERGLAAWWRDSIAGSSPALLALLHGQRVSPASLLRPVATIDARPAARVAPAPFDWRDLPRQIADLRGELAAVLAADGEQLLAWVGVKGNANGNTMRPDHVRARLAALAAFAGAESGLSPEIPASVEQFSGEYIAQSGRYQVPALALIGLCEQLDALRRQCLSLAGVVAHEAALALSRRRLELKAARGSIDHDDLLRIVRDALARPDGGEQFAASLRARYPVALIDECQDTDALQWEIFSRIYRPGNIGDDDSDDGDSANDRARRARDAPALILVGDPKQSIYSFRAADVYSYLEARGAGPACHGLHENQRSVPAMLDALNALFARDAPFLVREIGFSPAGAGSKARADFVDRRADERGAITVFSLDPAHGDAGAGMSGAMLARPEGVRRAVAATVAEIARLLSPDEALLAGRALGPADIAVLVNSHHEGGLVKRALQAAGIGAAEISRNSVLESRECDELLRVIAAIASPFDAGLVRGALATMLIDSLATAADEAGAPRALALLVAARSCWASAGPQAALWGLFSALDAYRRLATVRDGERRLTNLAHLCELLGCSVEAREGAAPALRWLMRMRSDPASLGADAGELRLESDGNLVRIVTVHKSKGLEYPIVFVPFAWSGREFDRARGGSRLAVQPAAAAIHYHEALGKGAAPAARWRAVIDFESGPRSAQWAQAATESYSEALRALYVAITRAQQRCYLCWGAVASAQFAALSWLLAGLDPREQKEWRTNSKDPAALDAVLAGESLRAWSLRANAASESRPATASNAGALRVLPAGAPLAQRSGQGGARPAPAIASPGAGALDRDEALARPTARVFDRPIPAPWFQSSFTALARMGDGHGPGHPVVSRPLPELPDHDQAIEPDAPLREGDAARFAFPSGALAGTCLHGILEQVSFAEPIEAAEVASALARVGYLQVEPAGVARWLDEVAAAPLPGEQGPAHSLAQLDRGAIVREMEFHLAVRDVDTAAVLRAIAAEYALDSRIDSHRWSGFVRGFIDLVYRAGERWYLLDWKSNHLGARIEDYDQDAMARSNAANAYPLQFCLYTLALHRLLRSRVAGYSYDSHFGRVQYVYLRGAGVRAGGAAGAGGRDANSAGYGVYSSRPSAHLIDTLDSLFAGGP